MVFAGAVRYPMWVDKFEEEITCRQVRPVILQSISAQPRRHTFYNFLFSTHMVYLTAHAKLEVT